MISSLSKLGGVRRTTGGLENVYPAPALLTLIEVTAVPVIDAVAVALVAEPNPTLLAIETRGVAVYPRPELVTLIEAIVPNPETIAVAAAPILGV